MTKGRLFGVEHEVFISSNGVPEISTIERLWKEAVSRGGIPIAPGNEVLGVGFQTDFGLATVHNDFCTHIIEIAFPPVETDSEFELLADDLWRRLDPCLRAAGITVVPGATLPQVPRGTILRPSLSDPTGGRLRAILGRRRSDSAYSDQMVFAAMVSTQINLDVDDALKVLPGAFGMLGVIAEAFCRPGVFNGSPAWRLRPLMYRDLLTAEYIGLPYPISVTRPRDYYSPFESTEFIRDYGFIAPRAADVVEFRIADSQDSSRSIVELVSLCRAVTKAAPARGRHEDDTPQAFYDHCLSRAPFSKFEEDVGRLRGTLQNNRDAEPRLEAALARLCCDVVPKADWHVRVASGPREIGAALRLRHDVFCRERQDRRYEVLDFQIHVDEDDDSELSTHLLAKSDHGDVLGTLRYTRPGARFLGWEAYDWSAIEREFGIAPSRAHSCVGRVDRVAIRADSRNVGVFKSLLLKCHDMARGDGAVLMVAPVLVGNGPAIRSMTSLGWRSFGPPSDSRGVICQAFRLQLSPLKGR